VTLLVGAGDQNRVEGGLIGAPLSLAGIVESLGIGDGGCLVDSLVLITVALHKGHAQPLEVATGVALQVGLQGLAKALFVELGNGLDAVVGQGAEDLDDSLLVGSQSRDGVVQLLGIELRQRRHQGQDHILELAAQLRLEVRNQVLAVRGLEGLGDLQTLDNAAPGQDLDDGLLVGAEALHGLAQNGRILDGIEGIRRVDGGRALQN